MNRTRTAACVLVTVLAAVVAGCGPQDGEGHTGRVQAPEWAEREWLASSPGQRSSWCRTHLEHRPMPVRVPEYGDEEERIDEFLAVLQKMC